MPILVKSSSDQRSAGMGAEQKRLVVSELIEALRGLTFKFELKISDVVESGAETPISIDDLTGATVEPEPVCQVTDEPDLANLDFPTRTVSLLKREGNPLEAKEMRQTNGSNSSVQAAPTKTRSSVTFGPLSSLKVGYREPIQAKPKHIEQASGDNCKPQFEETPKKADTPPISEPAPVVEQVQPVKQPPQPINREPEVSRPRKTHLVRGELKIGSAVSTICVNVVSQDEPVVLFVTYDQKKLVEIIHKIKDIEEDIEAQPLVKSLDVGDIVFGKSNDDDCWYRCMVLSVCADEVEIYFFDWGYNETVDMTRIRRLTELGLGLAKNPACAVKVKFTPESRPFIAEVMNCEKRFSMKVDSYEETDDGIYTATILNLLDD